MAQPDGANMIYTSRRHGDSTSPERPYSVSPQEPFPVSPTSLRSRTLKVCKHENILCVQMTAFPLPKHPARCILLRFDFLELLALYGLLACELKTQGL